MIKIFSMQGIGNIFIIWVGAKEAVKCYKLFFTCSLINISIHLFLVSLQTSLPDFLKHCAFLWLTFPLFWNNHQIIYRANISLREVLSLVWEYYTIWYKLWGIKTDIFLQTKVKKCSSKCYYVYTCTITSCCRLLAKSCYCH